MFTEALFFFKWMDIPDRFCLPFCKGREYLKTGSYLPSFWNISNYSFLFKKKKKKKKEFVLGVSRFFLLRVAPNEKGGKCFPARVIVPEGVFIPLKVTARLSLGFAKYTCPEMSG